MITFAKKLQQYDIDTKNVNPGVTTFTTRYFYAMGYY